MVEIRFAIRRLAAAPSFTAVSILTLALGIGGAAAMFSLVYSILLRPLEYHEPDRLVSIHLTIPKMAAQYPELPVNPAHYLAWRREVKAFESIGLLETGRSILTEGGRSERVTRARITANLFALLGVRPARGRLFAEGEDEAGKDKVVILSDSFWRNRFGADPGILGRTILLQDEPHEVVGVMPALLPFPRNQDLVQVSGGGQPSASDSGRGPDLWRPMGYRKPELANALGNFNMAVIARLRAGVGVAAAQAELAAQMREFAKTYPQPLEIRPVIEPLQTKLVGPTRLPLLLLLAAVTGVLLIVCTNLANLMLARGQVRRRELAVRAALGASAGQLIRQTAAEAFLLAVTGGALGIGVAYAAVWWVVNRAPVDLPRLAETRVDGWVLVFSAIVSLGCAGAFGMLPGWRAARTDPQEALSSAARGGSEGPASGWTRSVLVAAEVALSVTLVVGSGLLLNSFARVLKLDAVARTAKVVSAEIQLPPKAYKSDALVRDRWREAERKLAGLPGVESSGLVSQLPITGERDVNLAWATDKPRPLLAECPPVNFRYVSASYFATMGFDVEGRVFQEADGDARLVVISRNLAARLWPGENPIGKQMATGFDDEKRDRANAVTVIGIAPDVPMGGLTDKLAMVAYLPYWRGEAPRSAALVARTANDPGQLAGPLRSLVAGLDAQIPVPRVRTMEAVVSDSLRQRRFQMGLLSLFAAASLMLAALGIYGVVTYAVAQRTNEIGIRMALGAEPGAVARQVLSQSMRPVAAGATAGLGAALLLSRFLQSLVYGVSVTDPATYAASLAVLGLVALAACVWPARRAARVDPLVALRM